MGGPAHGRLIAARLRLAKGNVISRFMLRIDCGPPAVMPTLEGPRNESSEWDVDLLCVASLQRLCLASLVLGGVIIDF